MTNEKLNKGIEIKRDLDVLCSMGITISASKDLKERWKKWLDAEKQRLEQEFEELQFKEE